MIRSIAVLFGALALVSAVSCGGPQSGQGTKSTAGANKGAPGGTEAEPAEHAPDGTGQASASTNGTVSAGTAEMNSSPASGPDRQDDDAAAILKRLADFYAKSRSIQVDVARTMEFKSKDFQDTSEARFTFVAQRPNRLAIRHGDGGPQRLVVVSDGEKLYSSSYGTHTEVDAPPTFDRLVDNPELQTESDAFLLKLFEKNFHARATVGGKRVTYQGREQLDGVAVDHLKISSAVLGWELWVAAGATPLLERVRIDRSQGIAEAALNEQDDSMKLTIEERYTNWKVDEPLADDAFAFEPPAEPNFDNLFAGAEPAAKFQSPLVGKPAPKIELDLLGGDPFRLADHRGKHVVLLAFWTTWSRECVEQLPALAEVAAAYGDRDVVLYAVNLIEHPDSIRGLLEEQEIDLNVALDQEGTAAEAYDVLGIPMLVLVDKQGVVQSVHVGPQKNIKKTLGGEIDAVLDGKSLFEEKDTDEEGTPEPEEPDVPENGPDPAAAD